MLGERWKESMSDLVAGYLSQLKRYNETLNLKDKLSRQEAVPVSFLDLLPVESGLSF